MKKQQQSAYATEIINCEADQRLCFRYTDSTSLLLSKSTFLCLYSSVCVEHARKPHCRFSHDVAHLLFSDAAQVLVNIEDISIGVET